MGPLNPKARKTYPRGRVPHSSTLIDFAVAVGTLPTITRCLSSIPVGACRETYNCGGGPGLLRVKQRRFTQSYQVFAQNSAIRRGGNG